MAVHPIPVLLELTVAEQRFNAVLEVLRDRLTVIEVAERYGVSRQTDHGWLRRYRTGGLDASGKAPCVVVLGMNAGAIVQQLLTACDWAPPVHCSPRLISGRA